MKNWFKKTIIISAYAVPIGIAIGFVEAFFNLGLKTVTMLRNDNKFLFIPLLAIAGILLVYAFNKYAGKASKGMDLVFDVWNKKEDKIPLRIIPFMMGSTFLSHLCGASVGREGVAMQLGAAVSHNASKLLKYEDASKILIIAGMSAGFAALFRTPITAIAFAMEILVIGEMRYEAFIPTFVASYSAYHVAGKLGTVRETYAVSFDINYGTELTIKLIVIAIIFGIAGALLPLAIKYIKKFLEKFLKNPYVRVAVVGVVISFFMLFVFDARYSGTGATLMNNAFSSGDIRPYDWLLKLLFTSLALAAGFKGGEVTPLFTMGTLLGYFLGGVFNIPCEIVAALGLAAVFGSGTGAVIAPILIGGEIFGWEKLPLFILACVIARITNQWFTIYDNQRKAYEND